MQSHAKEEKLKGRRPIARGRAMLNFSLILPPKSFLKTDSEATM